MQRVARWLRLVAIAVAVTVSFDFRLAARPTVHSAAAGDPSDVETLKIRYRRPAAIPFPPDNAYTAERETLGRTLFFDPRLSASGIMSCATCHNPGFSWGDGLPTGIGHGMKRLGRRTPTILNVAWAERLFWDGRAASLEEQALGPIESPAEMNMPIAEAIRTLRAIAGYGPLFDRAYPGDGISGTTIAKALATFERTVVSATAPFDRWVAGERGAISAAAVRGFVVFNTSAGCAKCHSGWNFTDDGFRDIGVAGEDLGRGKLLPRIVKMQHAFKTPTLRNVDRRGPYMHDGSVATLEAVIELYERGGEVKRPGLASEVRPLSLSLSDRRNLVEFLRALTSDDRPVPIPPLPR